MATFAGTFENKVDTKGRVSVPAQFRAELTDKAEGVYLYPSLTDKNTIEACPAEWMDEMKAYLKRLPPMSQRRRMLTRAIFGPARFVKLEPDGRLVLPKEFIQLASIEKQAAFVGLAETFQICTPESALTAGGEATDHFVENGFGDFGDEEEV
ncbi:MAG: hypothetical protein OQJ97_06960 [Rhodospirillales bacterium]|nr:hypothetical protein [Rhodospirillales bacterium]